MNDQMNFSELNPKVVLGVAAHPDDLEFSAAGTLAKYADAGAEIHYLIVTDGSKGSNDPSLSATEIAKTRAKEQRAASKVIGSESVTFLGYSDGELELTMDLKKDIAREIRRIKPDVVITMDPGMLYAASQGYVNHSDHRVAGQATVDAVYPLARDHSSFPGLIDEGFQPHKTKTIMLRNFNTEICNYIVDITKHFDKKISSLYAHKSQVGDKRSTEEYIRSVARQQASSQPFELGESYIRIDIR